ncbi:N-acetylglutamate synthase-like GNAT family acetyltransferase [Sulfitobacter undariae]|uniref:N-acetylglutamate synthase-like GNAT family acetyltransferase n=1 Tax=Sulfitobacter undariae TaxID=1563671 RepID=A0A7W6H1W2_9RHOB|nr:GNAT family N-acetyltransferase [Sulfitobacter undariae]MBB3995163.1 N-acetylglutamate synthase-like GNAT family acetyltransferase [Sulfitobacter undariae]
MNFLVRSGDESDAVSAIKVLRASISELCSPDHNDDEREIAGWIANKTELAWKSWVNREDAAVYVAEIADEIVGVGMVDQCGEILLNYVRPDARFSGVSKSILNALEEFARSQHVHQCFLESTETAKNFYEKCGYQATRKGNLNLEKTL